MDKILRGVVKFGHTARPSMVKQLQQIKANPTFQPKALFFACMDSRVLPSIFTQTEAGDMFVVRNAGNMVPHSTCTSCSTEPAALQLACQVNCVQHVFVCGHSDCKAVNLLHDHADSCENTHQMSPLSRWVCRHGVGSIQRLKQLQLSNWQRPLVLKSADNSDTTSISAHIDPENKLGITDKLSQINTLQQLHHINSYDIVHQRGVYTHALWFDVDTAEVHYFCRARAMFVAINEHTVSDLVAQVAET